MIEPAYFSLEDKENPGKNTILRVNPDGGLEVLAGDITVEGSKPMGDGKYITRIVTYRIKGGTLEGLRGLTVNVKGGFTFLYLEPKKDQESLSEVSRYSLKAITKSEAEESQCSLF